MKHRIINNARKSNWIEKAKESLKNDDWLELSFSIALRVSMFLDKKKKTQKSLATEMSWTPQQLNKVLKGKDNLTLETICKLQRATGLTLIEAPYAELRAKIKREDYWETLNGNEEIISFSFTDFPISFPNTDIFQEKMILDSKDTESKSSTSTKPENHRLAMAA